MIPNGNQLIVYEEYINGKNLADLMKATATFDADEVTRLMLMLSDALTELHTNAIIHRDIKPSNIMISSDGVLKLIDFDASRVFEVGQKSRHRQSGHNRLCCPRTIWLLTNRCPVRYL